MNTIRFFFTATVAFLVVAIGGRGASCVDNFVRGYKCCPWDRLYDPEMRFCRPHGTDVEVYLQRFTNRLRHGFRVPHNDLLDMTYYLPPYCNDTDVLVDVPAVEVRGLMEAHPSPTEFPPDHCFDLTPSNELVARGCRPHDQYCGRANYTCVNKCCGVGSMYVEDPNEKGPRTCKYSEMPFTLSAYEADACGSLVSLSNNTVLPFHGGLSCNTTDLMGNRFMLTTDGNLHLMSEFDEWIIPDTDYCVEYYAFDMPLEANDLKAHVCTNAKQPPVGFVLLVIFTASIVCLVLTLIVYATVPYLRNAHGYYVMFYMACHLVYFVCRMIKLTINDDIDSPLCIPFGYLSLFTTIATCCWLNVICFDIYWMLRYNNSTNRNTSKSVRTIMYHIYCWGFSTTIVSTGYLFQHSQNEKLRKLAPDIGKYKCDFYTYNHYGTFIFYWLPTCGMLTANLILFLLINGIQCPKIKPELNKIKRTDSKTEICLVYKERFVMSIKLFLVFGIPFLFRMLCELFNNGGIKWKIINRIYYLQGVFLFVIFVAERKNIMDKRKKFRRPIVHSEMTPLNNIPGSS
ncbi:probable G-protein coupled receptor Mth-like 3 isoform X1 [Acyrthosiphon pisum]|uniref:G-protein coupled receptors family 2 profile 2 domain-containing protein n=1 Tax=Acyrthosiphon pisum TaxID=7029 RepID=A0A8R1W681_ACYPI|nr:probable G-protein coupled receptor Mth-like 3 isoform X1 [Acyrthosiphon pisum]|eukprot:XP_001947610.2 PREDICTED: probable G-protein coupled receptor Mth-like 3 isoform X1 [Acyrthosiphon pisum]